MRFNAVDDVQWVTGESGKESSDVEQFRQVVLDIAHDVAAGLVADEWRPRYPYYNTSFVSLDCILRWLAQAAGRTLTGAQIVELCAKHPELFTVSNEPDCVFIMAKTQPGVPRAVSSLPSVYVPPPPRGVRPPVIRFPYPAFVPRIEVSRRKPPLCVFAVLVCQRCVLAPSAHGSRLILLDVWPDQSLLWCTVVQCQLLLAWCSLQLWLSLVVSIYPHCFLCAYLHSDFSA